MSLAGQRRAILNFHGQYLAVGLTERFDDSMRLFKKLLPSYFSAVDEDVPSRKVNENTKRLKETLTPGARNVLRRNGHDFKLYAIVEQVFESKMAACFGASS